MTDRERLEALLKEADKNRGLHGKMKDGGQAGLGMIPEHYKRITLSEDEQLRLARIGTLEMFAAFGKKTRLHFTQALIAGACLSGDYDKIGIVTSSQYGKSWLFGRIGLLMAYNGHPVNVAAATSDGSDKIMRYAMRAVSEARNEIKTSLTAESLKRVDRLDQSLSKTRLSFPGKGALQALTLGDTFENLDHNKAVGEGGAYLVDEAARVSEKAMGEIGRREFSSIAEEKEPLVMISNPHKPGYFYDFITRENIGPRECVIWCDALTAVQEGRWTAERVLTSDFMEQKETLQKYLLCELPSDGNGALDDPIVRTEERVSEYRVSVLGIDAAYKGKDEIQICRCDLEDDGRIYFAEVRRIKKTEWIDGITSEEIINQVTKAYRALGCAACCVDVGYGVWLHEGLAKNKLNAFGINFGAGPTKERVRDGRYAAVYASNLRAEMHLDLKDVMEHRACEFSPQVYKQIRDVLPLIAFEEKSGGKKQVVPKQEIKAKIGHSPDAFDAVLLALHAAILYCNGAASYITNQEVA